MLVKEVTFANQNITSELSIGTFIPACDCTIKVRCDLGTTDDLLAGEAANFTFTAYITREATAMKVFDSGALAKPTAANTRYSQVLNSSFTLKAGETLDIKALSSLAGDSSIGGFVKFFDEYDAGSEPQLHVHSSGLAVNTGFSKAGAKLLIASAVTAGADGDTILVWPGAYPVSIDANKSINLVGMHRKGCLVTATGAAGPTCSLSDYGATVENFTITSAVNSSAAAGTLSITNSCCTARHLDVVLTANAVTLYGLHCGTTNVKTRMEDIYLTSDASGLKMDGSDFVGEDITIICTNARSGVPIGVKNQGIRARLKGGTIYVINNQDNAAAGATGFENDTTNGSDTCIMSDYFINVINEHANGAAVTTGIVAETPMILQNCDINVRNDGAGATYGLKADDDVLLVNCRIKVTASTDYSIAVATGKTVKCLNCQYDHAAISVSGTGAVIDVIDANGRVDVATVNAAVPESFDTAIPASPTSGSINDLISKIFKKRSWR